MCIQYEGTTSCLSGFMQLTAGGCEGVREQYCLWFFLFHRQLQVAIVQDEDTGFSCPLFSFLQMQVLSSTLASSY